MEMDKEFFYDLYWNKDMSLGDIAVFINKTFDLNITFGFVLGKFFKLKIPRRSRSESAKLSFKTKPERIEICRESGRIQGRKNAIRYKEEKRFFFDPEWQREQARKAHEKKHDIIVSHLCRDGWEKNLRKNHSDEEYREMKRKAARIAYQTIKNNGSIEFDGEKFLSKEEMECYKFLNMLGLSRDEINHDFHVESKFIDFFPLGKFFWEYHPIGRFYDTETYEEYYQRRRELLDSNGYQDYKLIVTTSLKEMDIIEREINDQKTNRT